MRAKGHGRIGPDPPSWFLVEVAPLTLGVVADIDIESLESRKKEPELWLQQLAEYTDRPRDDEDGLTGLGWKPQIAKQGADDTVDIEAQPSDSSASKSLRSRMPGRSARPTVQAPWPFEKGDGTWVLAYRLYTR